MRILSWNVNGIRSVARKGFLKWLEKESPDILCIQEIKIDEASIPKELLKPFGYHSYWNPAKRKGYAGTCVYCKNEPLSVQKGLGIKGFDEEGRALVLEYPEFCLINVYMPQGGRDKNKLPFKLRVYDELIRLLNDFKKQLILIGDFNIAHREVDLARPKSNKNNVMFTIDERKKIQKIMNNGFIDSFRELNKGCGNYTWWPYMNNLRERNVGWRIDYVFLSESLKKSLKYAFIMPEVLGSDHCPIGVEL
jgi:exodeoxyribonuclease-3